MVYWKLGNFGIKCNSKLKMKKWILLIIFVILFSSVVYAGIGNILTLFNPFTGKLDFITDTNQTGIEWIFSILTVNGNITADNILWNFTNNKFIILKDINNLVTIGNTTTTEKFNVAGNSSLEGNVFVGGNMIFPEGTGAVVVDIGWADDGTVVRLATSTDNVGIGTDSPGEKLHVIGNINLTGIINGSRSGSLLDCSLIDGGSDGDFCVDSTTGADPHVTNETVEIPESQITDVSHTTNGSINIVED